MRAKWLDRNLVLGSYYTLCTSPKMFKKELKHLEIPRDRWPVLAGSGNAVTHFFESGKGKKCAIIYIHLTDARDPIEVAALLVHEAVHLWQWNCQTMGESNPSSEFEAYSIQWLSQQLMYEYVRQTESRDTKS